MSMSVPVTVFMFMCDFAMLFFSRQLQEMNKEVSIEVDMDRDIM
jgi:type III secretory pathway component EscT